MDNFLLHTQPGGRKRKTPFELGRMSGSGRGGVISRNKMKVKT